MVTKHLIPGSDFPRAAKNESVLAAIEIAPAHCKLAANHKKDIQDALRRLVNNIDQIRHGYVLVPMTSYHDDKKRDDKTFESLKKAKQWVTNAYRDLCTAGARVKIGIRWVSDEPRDEATWIPQI
jgi:hypothetical protein